MPRFIRVPLRGRWAGAILFIAIVWVVILWLIQQSPNDWVLVLGAGILITIMMVCDIPIRNDSEKSSKKE
ncbi:MAG: hypothetical protein ACFFED_05400 [Candidatus Thorarchaeota archaeon]